MVRSMVGWWGAQHGSGEHGQPQPKGALLLQPHWLQAAGLRKGDPTFLLPSPTLVSPKGERQGRAVCRQWSHCQEA